MPRMAQDGGRFLRVRLFLFFLGTEANYNSRKRKKKPADKGQRTRDKEQN